MLWKAKSPLNKEDEEWQIECWRWLLENFGGIEKLRNTKVIEPSKEFFPPTDLAGHERVKHTFDLVAKYMETDPEKFLLLPHEAGVNAFAGNDLIIQNAPGTPLGTFQYAHGDKPVITYNISLMNDGPSLVATLVHELCHYFLLATEIEPPGGAECEEFATDLAVTYFDFGVFGANTAFQFEKLLSHYGEMGGWSTRRQGYLTEREWAFSLAIFTMAAQRQAKDVGRYLKPASAAHFKKCIKYLQKNEIIVDRVLSS